MVDLHIKSAIDMFCFSRLAWFLGLVGLFGSRDLAAQSSIPRIVINSMGHSARVQSLEFTPDGARIISVSEDKTVRVWNAANGEMLKKFESQIGDGPEGMFYASALSPDGKLLAVAGYPVGNENPIVIIDLEKGKQVGTAVGHTNVVNGLAFTRNGKFLVSASDDATIQIWKVAEAGGNYTVVNTLQAQAPVKAISLNPATQDLAAAIEGSADVIVYGLGGLDRGQNKFTPRTLKKHKGSIYKVAYSPDGQFLASSSDSFELNLWKSDGTFIKSFPSQDVVTAIAFSADSKMMVVLDGVGNGESFGVPAGNKFSDFKGHDHTVQAAAFAPSDNGTYIVASAGGWNNEICLWNPFNGKLIRKIKGKGNSIEHLAFGQGLELYVDSKIDGQEQYSASYDFFTLKLNASPNRYTPPIKNLNEGIKKSSDFKLDLPKGKAIELDPGVDGAILDFQATLEGHIVIASNFSLKMFDRNGYPMKEFVGHSGAVRSITLSPDGRYLASGGEDQSIIMWKISETGASQSIRQTPEFKDEQWGEYFTSMNLDSLSKEPSKEAWKKVIEVLKVKDKQVARGIEEVYKNLAERLLPFATLFITEDNEWVCWTQRGYFSCTSAGSQYFGWHINRGIHQLADFFTAEQYFEILYKPKHLEKSMAQGRRVEEILREEGERIFDLSKLQKPSAGLFDNRKLISSGQVQYQEGRLVTTAKALTLDVEIFDGGGGVKEVNIYHNDKLIQTDRDVKTARDNDKIVRSYTTDLVNEMNEFKVVVVSYQKVESRPDVVRVEYVGERMATASLHILAIGINKYKNQSYNLNYAEPDARSFVEQLASRKQNIFKGVMKTELYNEEATKDNIVAALKSLATRAKPEDVFVFYYAGHGSQDEENKNADGESPFYFIPHDVTKIYGDPGQLQAKALASSELVGYLSKIKSTKQIILMDACHSGGAVKDFNVRAAASDEKALIQLSRSSGSVIIASSGSKQFATEFDVLKHGVFTYALLEALSGKAAYGDSQITANELKLYMEDRVPELSKQYGGSAQYPTGRVNGQDFPISVLEEN